MKRHTQSTLWAAVAFATLLSACGGKATKVPQNETETDSALAESPYLKTLHMIFMVLVIMYGLFFFAMI